LAIAEMTRVFIAGPAGRQEKTLRVLQQFGVLHVEPVSELAVEYEQRHSELLSRVKKINQIITALKRFRPSEGTPSNPPDCDDLAT